MWNPDDADDEPGFFFPNLFGGEEHEEEDEEQSLSSKWSFVFLALFIVVLLALLALFYILYRFLPPLLRQVWQYAAGLSGKLMITILLLTLAGGFFWLREKRRFLYGLIELCFGVVSIWEAVGQARVDNAKWAVVIAAVYLVVRGLDNLVTGYRKYLESGTPIRIEAASSASTSP